MLHIESHVQAARNASQARVMLKYVNAALTGGYHGGVSREFAECAAKDANGTVQSLIGTDGVEVYAIRHTLKGADLKSLKADLACIKKSESVTSLPAKVDAKAYQLDTATVAPLLLDMTVRQVAELAELHGVKMTVHHGVVTMGAGKLAVRVDSTDGALMDKDGAEARAIQGKLNALQYIVSKGGKLTKSQATVLAEARAANAVTPGLFAIGNELAGC